MHEQTNQEKVFTVPVTIRPALLTTGMVMSGLAGATFLCTLLSAFFDLGTYTINDEVVSGAEFLRRAGFLFGAMAALLLYIWYTLYRNEPDSRPLMILFWLAIGAMATVYPLIRPDDADFDVTWLVPFAIAVWYLYFKADVVAYYRRSRALHAHGGGRGQAGDP